jgi:hypothetical protein
MRVSTTSKSRQALAWAWGGIEAEIVGDATIVRPALARRPVELIVRQGRLARGPGYAGAAPALRHGLARMGAVIRLRERGRYFVHAAGAVDPRGRAWLLSGDSGSGKSTLTYALAQAGWRVLGDDGVVLEVPSVSGSIAAPAMSDANSDRPAAQGSVWAHAWREPLRVSLDLEAHFPDLVSQATSGGVAGIPGDPRRRIAVSVPFARGAPLAALVFLVRGERDVATPLTPTAALSALIPQSPWVLVDDDHACAHLAALGHVAASVRAFRLEHSSRQLSARDGIARTLGDLL